MKIEDVKYTCKFLSHEQQLDLWVWWFGHTEEGVAYYIDAMLGKAMRESSKRLTSIIERLDRISKKIDSIDAIGADADRRIARIHRKAAGLWDMLI